MTTVLISALVSAFVTLAIEWLAKPTLEARKVRILEDLSARRRALRTCRMILQRLGTLGSGNDDTVAFLAEVRRDLDGLARELETELTDVVLQMPSEGMELSGRAVGFLRGALKSKCTHRAVSDLCSEPFLALAHILETPSMFSLGRRVARRRAALWLSGAGRKAPALPSPDSEGP